MRHNSPHVVLIDTINDAGGVLILRCGLYWYNFVLTNSVFLTCSSGLARLCTIPVAKRNVFVCTDLKGLTCYTDTSFSA